MCVCPEGDKLAGSVQRAYPVEAIQFFWLLPGIGGRCLFRPDPAVRAIIGLRFRQSVPQGELGLLTREFRGCTGLSQVVPKKKKDPGLDTKRDVGPTFETNESDNDDSTIPSPFHVPRDGFHFGNCTRGTVQSITMDSTLLIAFWPKQT
uniref:Uncharacterized protein n=1 Tax=Panagrellus redivivus TaxID=6233 RepID=A0A7E4UWY8_PANRE